MSEDIYILGIESSCEVLSNIIASQVPIHRKYGGVVPEIASRNHIRNVLPVIDEALAKAQVPLEKINAVAVTYGPGLVGALLVGLSAGKALAWAADKPLIGVNHLEGHVFANFLNDKDLKPPFLALVVSGGHTASFWARPATMPPVKPSIKWRVFWGCLIPAGRRWKNWRLAATRWP